MTEKELAEALLAGRVRIDDQFHNEDSKRSHFCLVVVNLPAPKPKTRGEVVAEKMVADGQDTLCSAEAPNVYASVKYLCGDTTRMCVRQYIAAAIDAEIARERETCACLAQSFDNWKTVPKGFYGGPSHEQIAHAIRNRTREAP